VCDDGNTVTESTCAYGTASCTACTANCGAQFSLTGPRCGDNVVNGTGGDAEVCDDGNTSTEANCPYGTPTCTVCASDCKSQPARTGFFCGDNLTNGPEVCDDGNAITETSCSYGTASCNVCNAGCTAQLPRTGERCGDGVTNGSGADLEICDDGNQVTETLCPYGQGSCTLCDATCDTNLPLTGNVCGDGVVNAPNEQCDDRNTLACGTCNANCTVAQAPLEATGTIRTVSDNTLNDDADGQSFTLFDGVNAGGTTFCFKLTSPAFMCPAGQIVLDFTASNPNDEAVGDAVIAAINGVGATLQITASKRSSNPWVRLTNDNLGGQGNVQMQDTVVSTSWVMTGMSGGGAADCPTGTACVTGNDCFSGICTAPTDGGVISTCD
jgi:cysteine-rich repeat protein